MSFSVALLHNPELLILDEPTVGVDPMLRQNIWNHLTRLSTENKKTILITTHYIEEAKQAHYVGLMRQGKLLGTLHRYVQLWKPSPAYFGKSRHI